MPKTCCCVPGCSNTGGHKFPVNEKRRKAWVLAIKRQDGQNKGKAWTPTSTSVVCKKHFLPTDYKESTATGIFSTFSTIIIGS